MDAKIQNFLREITLANVPEIQDLKEKALDLLLDNYNKPTMKPIRAMGRNTEITYETWKHVRDARRDNASIIPAIKILRSATDMHLIDAKYYVENEENWK